MGRETLSQISPKVWGSEVWWKADDHHAVSLWFWRVEP